MCIIIYLCHLLYTYCITDKQTLKMFGIEVDCAHIHIQNLTVEQYLIVEQREFEGFCKVGQV